MCHRHAPNYPPVPKIINACPAVSTPLTPVQLKDRLLNALGLEHSKSIKIERPQQNFQQARSVPTNAATCGPQVQNVINSITAMSEAELQQLSLQLSHAGL